MFVFQHPPDQPGQPLVVFDHQNPHPILLGTASA
jgi:hypothetical protein